MLVHRVQGLFRFFEVRLNSIQELEPEQQKGEGWLGGHPVDPIMAEGVREMGGPDRRW